MADAPEIKVKLTAEDTGVSAAIKELTSQLKNLKKQHEETAASGITLSKAFEAIAGSILLVKIAEFGKKAFDSAIEIGKMSDKTGITTETLSVFHHVAEEAGVSTEGVDKALIKAARSITEFQQGSAKAAVSFKLLGITQKDFAGLKPDQMLTLVTTRVGQMGASFQKTTAIAAIFGQRAGTDIIPVANAIAGEGFDKVTESVSKLGLLLSRDTTDAFRAAKASMQELEDAGKGMATQFEAGLLPAISDVADALLEALGDDGAGGGFSELGKTAGGVIKGIAFGLMSVGVSAGTAAAEIEEVFDLAFNHTQAFAHKAVLKIAKGLAWIGGGAAAAAAVHMDAGDDPAAKDFDLRMKAIEDRAKEAQQKVYDAIYKTPEQEAQANRDRIKKLRPENQKDAPEVTAAAAPTDAAAKAQLALNEKKLQDELAIHRAYAKQNEQVYKDMFDKGEISLDEYFTLRRRAVTKDTSEEIKILQKGVASMNKEAHTAALAEKSAATPKDADKQKAAKIQALTKIEELQTKISEAEINASTKITALNTEEFKDTAESQKHDLEFQKELDALQGKKQDVAREELAMAVQKRTLELRQEGASQQRIDAEIAQLTELKTARADFAAEEKKGQTDLKLLDDEKMGIEDKVQSGKLFQAQADQQILDLYRQQLPALQKISKQLTDTATTEEEIAHAADFKKGVDKIATEANTTGQQMKTIKRGLQDALTGGMTQSFALLFQGTQNIGMAFRNMASSVISSIAQMIAQMYIQIMVSRLLKAAMGGFSAGGVVPAVGGAGHAEGGLIRGPGGPKSDSIPARLSPGEYVVKEAAVSAFGVQNLEAINRGLKIPSLERLALPKFAEGGLVGNMGGGGGDSNINLGIGLDEGLILKHLSSKAAGNIILQHLTNNPKAAGKALSRSD
jgi:hypothetical protein